MPVYEYMCADCAKKFELFVPQRMDTDGVVCRHCHGSHVRKLVSTFASPGGGSDLSFGSDEVSAAPVAGGCCGGSCGCGH